jgi:hypothetical protein
VLARILSVLPKTRMAQLRTPLNKQKIFGTLDPLPAAQAYSGSSQARTGHHNDCFLASATDYGTYTDVGKDYPYLEAETLYLPMGGETCVVNPPRSDCPTALGELERFHWSYLNMNYNQDVLSRWVTDGCMDEVKRRLGYRLSLQEGMYTRAVSPGGGVRVSMTLRNDGWAAPFNPRLVELILRHSQTGALHRAQVPVDPRYWLTGGSYTINQTVGIPDTLPEGSYELLLNLPDPEPTLYARPEYAIRLANEGLWEPETGFHQLHHTVVVSSTAQSARHSGELYFEE